METPRVDESQSIIRLLYDAKGVLAFQLPGAVTIRLLTAGTPEAADTVMAALDEIWNLTPQDSGWTIEMGGVGQLHHRIIGLLLIRQLGLESQQRRLELVGVRPELLMSLRLGGASIASDPETGTITCI